MSTFRSWSIIVLLACLGAVALHASLATADPITVAQGATYLLTIKDATTGAFASRGAMTLHGDHTLSAIDSGQEGPPSSSPASWGHGHKTARTARSAGRSISTSPRPQMWRAWIIRSSLVPTTRT